MTDSFEIWKRRRDAPSLVESEYYRRLAFLLTLYVGWNCSGTITELGGAIKVAHDDMIYNWEEFKDLYENS